MVLQYFIHSFFIKRKPLHSTLFKKPHYGHVVAQNAVFEWFFINKEALNGIWAPHKAHPLRQFIVEHEVKRLIFEQQIPLCKWLTNKEWALQIKSQHNGAKNTRPIQDLLQSRCTWSASKSWPVQSYWFIDFAIQSTICHVSKFHKPKLTCI